VARVTLNTATGSGGGRAVTLDAALVGVDAARDVALLRVSPAALTAELGLAPSLPSVGDAVYAIGSPYGFAGSMTAGIVAALGRAVPNPAAALPAAPPALAGVLQSDAPTAPGSSGSPLIDGTTGRVVGLAVAAFAEGGTAVARATFAVPAPALARTLAALAASGTAPPPLAGVTLAPREVAAALVGDPAALLIQAITPGSPAAAAGLRATRRGLSGVVAGDVVVAPGDAAGLAAALDGAEGGARVRLRVAREGQEVDVVVQF